MRQSINAFQSTGAEVTQTYYLYLLADAFGKTGRFSEGLAALDQALGMVEKNEERFWEAELRRLQGELLLLQGDPVSEVERCFEQAIEIARRQQAKSLELRAVMSLARLWQRQGKAAQARQMVTATYDWFTEGFDTPDLNAARALLEGL